MTSLLSIFDADPASAPTSRRDALGSVGRIGLGAALAAVPFLKPSAAKAQTLDGDAGILNYALTLEYLERSFYRQGTAAGFIPSAVAPLFDRIRQDEEAHVTLLRTTLSGVGADPVDYTDDDFEFGSFVQSYDGFAALAQGLEDTGVRAYKGRAADIMNKDYLTVALQIHSVEARHAAAIRSLSASPATKAWISNDGSTAPMAIRPVYGAGSPAASFPAESNTSQGGINLATALTGYSALQIAEAFDEPLDGSLSDGGTVITIAGQFITGDEGDGDD